MLELAQGQLSETLSLLQSEKLRTKLSSFLDPYRLHLLEVSLEWFKLREAGNPFVPADVPFLILCTIFDCLLGRMLELQGRKPPTDPTLSLNQASGVKALEGSLAIAIEQFLCGNHGMRTAAAHGFVNIQDLKTFHFATPYLLQLFSQSLNCLPSSHLKPSEHLLPVPPCALPIAFLAPLLVLDDPTPSLDERHDPSLDLVPRAFELHRGGISRVPVGEDWLPERRIGLANQGLPCKLDGLGLIVELTPILFRQSLAIKAGLVRETSIIALQNLAEDRIRACEQYRKRAKPPGFNLKVGKQ